MKKIFLLLLPLFIFAQTPVKIAFVSDIHFQDLYGKFADNSFKGAKNPVSGKSTFLRTMDSQLHSTRLFNENYFAFLTALEEIKNQGIKVVVFPGDFTDNGHPFNLRGIHTILNDYSKKFGMRFLITTGNHDPVRPFERDAGLTDFLDENGDSYSIASIDKKGTQTIITKDFREGGYLDVLTEMSDFGFAANRKDLFWQTPFSKGNYENYNFQVALEDSKLNNRQYEVEPGFKVPDLSYLAEPIKGIWLLAIDGNTYIPKKSGADPADPNSYSGADAGYNNVLSNKTHLFAWIKKISEEASKRNKTLIAFTHYPVLDYNDGASKEITELLGKGKWQMNRLPPEEVAQKFAEAGIKLHFAGHMHINDTGIRQYPQRMLVNVQVPTLAAYLPGYKVLTIKSPDNFTVETKTVATVPNFNELFPFYEKEYQTLMDSKAPNIWNQDILKTKSYGEFIKFYQKELVRLRMIPEEWPKEFIENAQNLDGNALLNLSLGRSGQTVFRNDFKNWNFIDAITDLYKFQSADELAKKDIPKERLKAYETLENNFEKLITTDAFSTKLKLFFSILKKLSNGEPSDNFEINFKNSTLKALPGSFHK